jgi:hypothetical protein
LSKAESVSCGIWPLRAKDLQIDGVAPVRGTGTAGPKGFLATGLNRNAGALQYWAPFRGKENLDGESFLNLDLGRGAVVIGGAWVGSAAVTVLTRSAGGKNTLEVRTIHDNVVRHKSELGPTVVTDGTLVAAQGGAWATLRGEDGSFRMMWIALPSLDKITSRPVVGASFAERPVVLPRAAKAGGTVVVSREGNDAARPFGVRWVGMDGKAGDLVPLDLQIANQVESWSAFAYGGGYYMAVVDGDSLVGASELKVGHFEWNGATAPVRWVKGLPMRDEHVTEPVWTTGSKGLEVLVLKWIDEESTVARYQVAGGALGKPSYAGVFPKGSRIVDAFNDDGDVWTVIRSRSENGWTYRVCEM